jgi:hypothetical protein
MILNGEATKISTMLMIGLDEVGLYRVPGSVSSVKALTTALNAGEDVDMDDARWIDVNVVAGTFKSWLRELPESLLTPALYDKFIMAVGINRHKKLSNYRSPGLRGEVLCNQKFSTSTPHR